MATTEAQKAVYHRMFDAVKPRLRTCDLPKAKRDGLVQMVHQAASLCPNYAEVARFVRVALNKLDRKALWSVAVARGMYVQAKKQARSASTLSVPALLSDLVHLTRDAKTAAEADKIVSAASRSSLLGFTVLVFMAASDETDFKAQSQAASTTAAAGGAEAAAAALPHGQPFDYEVVKAHYGAVVEVPPAGAAAASGGGATGKAAAAGSAAARADTEAALAPVLGLVGHLQRSGTGLDASSEGAFCSSLVRQLSEAYGPTWHAFLAPALHRCKVPRVPATPARSGKAEAGAGASSSAAIVPAGATAAAAAETKTAEGAAAASSAGTQPAAAPANPAEIYTLGGLLPASVVLELMHSPCHAPGYDVTWDYSGRRQALPSPAAGAEAGSAAGDASSAGEGEANGAGASGSGAAGGSTGADAGRAPGQGKRPLEKTAKRGGGSSTAAPTGPRTRPELRYLELTLHSQPAPAVTATTPAIPDTAATALAPASGAASAAEAASEASTPAPSSAAAGAPAAAAAAAAASAAAAPSLLPKTPEQYHLLLFRTSQPFLEALYEGRVEHPSAGAAAAAGAGGGVVLGPDGAPLLLAGDAASSSAPGGSSDRVCFGLLRDWGEALDTLRYGLYAVGALAFFAFIRLNLQGMPHCARAGVQAPWGPALLLLVASMLPPGAGVALGIRHMLDPAVAATMPLLWPGGVVPHDVAAAAAAAEAAPLDAHSAASLSDAAAGALGGDADAAAAAGAASHAYLPLGCTLHQAYGAEIELGQRTGLMYVAVACLMVLGAMKWARKSVDASRLKAVLKSAADDTQGARTQARSAGGAGGGRGGQQQLARRR